MTDAQFNTIVLLLQGIHDLLAAGIQSAEDEPGEECPHPDDARVSLATPADPDHWICFSCKHEHKGVRGN